MHVRVCVCGGGGDSVCVVGGVCEHVCVCGGGGGLESEYIGSGGGTFQNRYLEHPDQPGV